MPPEGTSAFRPETVIVDPAGTYLSELETAIAIVTSLGAHCNAVLSEAFAEIANMKSELHMVFKISILGAIASFNKAHCLRSVP